jgi:hypothetical protein
VEMVMFLSFIGTLLDSEPSSGKSANNTYRLI